jgi:hypothetical protein
MADLSKLSDEELSELESDLDSSNTNDLSSLSDEELLELEADLGEATAITQEEDIDIQTGGDILSAVGRTTAQGITFGLSDEIEAAVNTGIRKVQGDETEASTIFQQEAQLAREKNEQASDTLPLLGTVSEIGGGVASIALTGGLFAGMRGALALGGVAGVGFGDSIGNKTASEIARDFATGAALGGVTEKVLGTAFRKMKRISAKATPKEKAPLIALGETQTPSNQLFEKQTVKEILKQDSAGALYASKEGQQLAIEAIDTLPNTMNEVFKKESKFISDFMEDATQEARDLGIKFNSEEAVFGLLEDMKNPGFKLGTDIAGKEIIQDELLSKGLLSKNSPTPINSFSVDDIINTAAKAKELASNLDTAPTSKAALKRFADNIMKPLEQDIGIAPIIQRQKAFDQVLELAPKRPKDIFELLNKVSLEDINVQNREFLKTLEGYSPELTGALQKELSPKLQFISNVIDVQGSLGASAAAARFGVTSGVVSGGRGVLVQAAQVTAKARRAFKVPRSVSGIINNKDITVSKLAETSPKLATILEEAIDNRNVNAIRSIATQVIQQFGDSEFEAGIGFEGQIVTEQELQEVEGMIKQQPISLRNKIDALNTARSGTIPDLSQVPQQQPFLKEPTRAPRDSEGNKIRKY